MEAYRRSFLRSFRSAAGVERLESLRVRMYTIQPGLSVSSTFFEKRRC